MNSSYNEEEDTDESLRPKSAKRIKLEHNVDTTRSKNEPALSSINQTTEQPQQLQASASDCTTTQNAYSKQELIDYFEAEYAKIRESYVDKLLELFYLEENLNLTEYYIWRKKPPTNTLLLYFKQIADSNEAEFEQLQLDKSKLDYPNLTTYKIIPLSAVPAETQTPSSLQVTGSGSNQQQQQSTTTGSSLSTSAGTLQSQTPLSFTSTSNLTTSLSSNSSNNNANANSSFSTHSNTTSSQFTTPSAVSSSKLTVNIPQTSSKTVISSPSPYHHTPQPTNKFPLNSSISQQSSSKSLPSTPLSTTVKKSSRFPHGSISIRSPSLSHHVQSPITPANISSVYESSIGSKEQIVERAKQEAYVMQRVQELRKEGLWSAKRLPRVQEPPREKAHWDYLLEEMTWLANDFAQERHWKRSAAKKCVRWIMKYHQDKELQADKVKKENVQRLKKIASTISKEIRLFWASVDKLVDFKMQTKLEEQRKKALDLHLNFIVDQTEQYSSWLAEGLNQNPSSLPTAADEENSNNSNEEAIEEEDKKSIQDQEAIEGLEKNDQEFNLSDDQDESDVEDTIAEQERNENKQQNVQELADLQNEAELPIEDLLKWYAEMENKNEESEMNSESMAEDEENEDLEDAEDEEDETTMNESEEDQSNEEVDKEEIGVEYLINLDSEVTEKSTTTVATDKKPTIEITDIAAGAESIQPKGNTLLTAQVQTKVPFLLRGELREYQLIGLDWLVQMYSKNLNGVLADEMGLGKTIQTIALLAHLACEKGIWGPHLIVVPTSVMINWECEFKKWCPAFKIITYYGSPKERKLKRQGWTKPNQFHICITSYKLVVQDHNSFRRKKWCYLILDEAQHIKNFKSQRWQMLLNFNTSRRLLLTGTPLQNNLMELWSLMHFLMPNVFTSHRDFKDWFVNPVTGMIEGNQEFNETLIKRLHKVLRPFLLRRIKADVEKQLPKKYEHILPCRLSKRQRFLYEEFMSLTKTKETLESGNFLSVINVLMQLRKVCNHPNLFETRSVHSPFSMRSVAYNTASLCTTLIDYNPFNNVDLNSLSGNLVDLCSKFSASDIHRINSLQVPSKLIEEIDQFQSDLPPKIPVVKFNNNSNQRSLFFSTSSVRPTSVPHSLRIRNNQQQQFTINNNNSIETDELKKISIITPSRQQNKPTQSNRDEVLRTASASKQLSTIELRKDEERKDKLKLLARVNKMKCNRHSLYTKDLLNIVDLQSDPKAYTCKKTTNFNVGQGYFNCLLNQNRDRRSADYEHYSDTLTNILKTPAELIDKLNTQIDRFTFVVPAVSAPRIKIHVPHPSPSKRSFEEYFENTLHYELLKKSECLHKIVSNMAVQFPELRLIQYDCGKLQTLDKLLWELKAGGHRALIFTQMSRMLDIFEQFLNYHGHTYLRLDGSTKIDQRQALMERFNADKRIFCFILSTRSGGVGVNLTGADTVIFYDSDWNPTLDLQAQDRCHRIGQTRDVHIYRLVSEKTVEENILKKAKQKQFLNDIAIEGGNFTTAFFKGDTIEELFNVNNNTSASASVQSLLQGSTKVLIEEVVEDEKTTKLNNQIGQALHSVEEENDVVAAKTAIAEASAEFAEFDESIPLDDRNEEKSPEEEELERIVNELTPIERYAMKFLESIQEPIQAEQLKQAEEEIEAQKKEWELGHLKSLKEENERALRQQEQQDDILTMNKEDVAQIYISKINEDIVMPTWAPPTPPQDENDYYFDQSLAFMYDSEIMTESQLPPVYVPKESKRIRLENIVSRKQTKLRKDENVNIPRSLFDKPSPFIVKLRKEVKIQKLRGSIVGGPDIPQLQRILNSFGSNNALPQPTTLQQQAAISKQPNLILHGTQQESQIHWGINEDWALVEIIQKIQELPINLLVLSPGHIPNWDFVSAHVNSKTSTYRSPKLCRHHYETVILAKEGRGNEQPTKKLKKIQKQAALQAANNQQNQPTVDPAQTAAVNKPVIRPVKISNLFVQDNNSSFTQMMNTRFTNILQIAEKRQPTLKPVFINKANQAGGKKSIHLQLLQDNHINYDQPLLPTVVAQNRADRIAKETEGHMSKMNYRNLMKQQNAAKQINTTQQIQQIQIPTVNVQQSNVAQIQQQQQQNTNNPQQQQTSGVQAQIIPSPVSVSNVIQTQGPRLNTNISINQANLPKIVTQNNPVSMSYSANQQISNLAKALSQAAANFQPSQNTIQAAQQGNVVAQQSTSNLVNPQQQQTSGVQAQIIPSPVSVSNVIQAQGSRLNANISINQANLPKIVTQSTPVSIAQASSQTANLTVSGASASGTSQQTVLSIPQQKIITATITNSNATRLTPAQIQAYRQQIFLSTQKSLSQSSTASSQASVSNSALNSLSSLSKQTVTTQQIPTTAQITLPVSNISNISGNTHTVVQQQQTASTAPQNIVRPTTSVPTIIASNALPIVPISSTGTGQPTKISAKDIQIIQARNPRVQASIQQPSSQQIQIASLTPKPMSTGLPTSMTVPISTNQHQKILTTRTPQLYARKPTEEELEQFLSNRNAQKNQANIVTSATIVQSSSTAQSTTTSSQQQQPQTTTQQASTTQQSPISIPTLAQVQFLHIPSTAANQITKEGTNSSGTAYLIYSSKGNTK